MARRRGPPPSPRRSSAKPAGRVALADADEPELGRGGEFEVDVAERAGRGRGPVASAASAASRSAIRYARVTHAQPCAGPGSIGSSSRSARAIHPLAAAKLAKLALYVTPSHRAQSTAPCQSPALRNERVGGGALLDARLVLAQPPQRGCQAEPGSGRCRSRGSTPRRHPGPPPSDRRRKCRLARQRSGRPSCVTRRRAGGRHTSA